MKIKVLLAATAACVVGMAAFGSTPIAAYESEGVDGYECAVIVYASQPLLALEDRTDCGGFLAVVAQKEYQQTINLFQDGDSADASNIVDIAISAGEPFRWKPLGDERIWFQGDVYSDGSANLHIGSVGNRSAIRIYRDHPFEIVVSVKARPGQEWDPD